jgi:NAD(P)-dependent dehydrogenase (short-subunit alcohol dehydrogenase family)
VIDVDLSGKAIVVTGGSSGIGETTARVCLEAGARVTICARGSDALTAAIARFEAAGYGDAVMSTAADVSSPLDVERAFDAAQARFGSLDGVVHAAAILEPIGTILDVDPLDWLHTIEVDLFGTFLVAREAARRMRERGGRIALFSGGGASGPFPNYTAYACSKVAVVRFAETVAEEMRPFGIEINAIAPGFVATPMHEQTLRAGAGLAGEAYFAQTQAQLREGSVPAETGARAAAFLLSDAARGITGKFVAPRFDDYARWPEHLEELRSTDVFTLRRILPNQRGMDWQ